MAKKKKGKSPGRPPELDNARRFNLYLGGPELRTLTLLSRKWKCSQSEVVRRIIRETSA